MSIELRDYETTAVMGEGAFALVKRFSHRKTGDGIAVKSLRSSVNNNPVYQARLKREITLLERLRGVAGVVDLLGHSGNLVGPGIWYAMPVAAMNLHRFIKRNNTALEEPERVVMFRRILSAIQSAHELGILHRDISPSNALVLDTRDCNSVVVCDFGLGRDLSAQSNRTRSSVDNYGHAYYVAPEQRDSLKSATVQSDIYSLGKLLNFVMTGRDPDHHHRCSYSPVIQRATRPSATERYPSAAHFAEHFDRIEALRTDTPPRNDALKVLLADNGSAPHWDQVHRALAEPEYRDHVYSGYIEPVIDFFSSDDRLAPYCDAVGAESARFVRVFLDEMEKCLGTVGWPFSAMNGFASFLGRLFHAVVDTESRGGCLVGMWSVAYGADQWGAQSSLLGILESGEVDDDEAMILADFILEQGMSVGDDRLYDNAIPAPIRNAVRQTGADG